MHILNFNKIEFLYICKIIPPNIPKKTKMLDKKINNKSLFKNENKEKQTKDNKNIIEHSDCIIQMEKLYKKLEKKDNDYIFIKKEHDKLYNNFIDICNRKDHLFKENNYLKNEIEYLKNQINGINLVINDKSKHINDELLYIDYDIFEYESKYILKKKIISYEKQLDYIDEFLYNNNVSSFEELSQIILYYKDNNNNKNTDIGSDKETIKPIIKSMSKEEMCRMKQQIDNSFKNIKNKLSTIKEGDVIIIKGNQRKAIIIKDKLKLCKIENPINKIKMVEEEFNNYCKKQISWAKDILGSDYDDIKIIKLLDIFNKLINNKDNLSSESESENEYSDIYNNIKLRKMQEFEEYIKLGNNFTNKNINSRKDLTKEDLVFIKEIIKTSDIKYGTKDEKINRFINQCKRYSIISQKISNNNIINGKCKTIIRDINNKDFDDLLKLIENKNEEI